MHNLKQKVAVVGGLRIPFAKSFREYSRTTNQEMLTHVVSALVKKFGLEGKRLGDVSLGAVIKSSLDWNLSREVVLGSGLDPATPAFNVQRACGTSLDTANLIALKIASGQIEAGIAGGSDTNSDLPVMAKRSLAWKLVDLNNAKDFGGKLLSLLKIGPGDLKPVFPGIVEPRTGMSMGQHTEKMVQQWGIRREDQDQLAYESHLKAVKAYGEGFYEDLLVPYKNLSRDTIVRADTSLAQLAKLRPVFERSAKGTLTAGNSTLFTDGTGAILLASESYAEKNKLPVLAYFSDCESAAVDYVHGPGRSQGSLLGHAFGAGLLMAPTFAVARLLKRNNLSLQDFDFYEIHEAFAGQVLCTLKAWEDEDYCKDELGLSKALGSIDRNKMNVKGGSLALGHPFGATGSRVVGAMAKILHSKGKGRGLVSICTAGGMGVAAILEK